MLRCYERKFALFNKNPSTAAVSPENIRHANWHALPDAALIPAVFSKTLGSQSLGLPGTVAVDKPERSRGGAVATESPLVSKNSFTCEAVNQRPHD